MNLDAVIAVVIVVVALAVTCALITGVVYLSVLVDHDNGGGWRARRRDRRR